MKFFRETQVDTILDARRAYDAAAASGNRKAERRAAASLTAVVRESTGHEINAAMDDYGQGTESWAAIR